MSSQNQGGRWPDSLSAPDPETIPQLLSAFWRQLSALSAILGEDGPVNTDGLPALTGAENLLAIESIAAIRATVVDMMLALNGIARPTQTTNLNIYLSENQRTALERTLLAPKIGAETWIGQAVSLVVIYRWYAPQLVKRYNLVYPTDLEAAVWATLRRRLYNWPANIATDGS